MAKTKTAVRANAARPAAARQPLRARDLMEKDVITIAPETPIADVQRLFVEDEIHGAPVVDEDGRVLGVISTADVLRIGQDYADRLDDFTAADAMTKELVSAPPTATAVDLATTMYRQRVHRILIVEDRALVGIVTTFDLLRALNVPARSPVAANTRKTGYSR
jgi:CBS domain-containing protein